MRTYMHFPTSFPFKRNKVLLKNADEGATLARGIFRETWTINFSAPSARGWPISKWIRLARQGKRYKTAQLCPYSHYKKSHFLLLFGKFSSFFVGWWLLLFWNCVMLGLHLVNQFICGYSLEIWGNIISTESPTHPKHNLLPVNK